MNFDETLAFVAEDYISGIQNLELRPHKNQDPPRTAQQSNPTHKLDYRDVPWDACVCDPWRKECDCGAKEKGSPRQGY